MGHWKLMPNTLKQEPHNIKDQETKDRMMPQMAYPADQFKTKSYFLLPH